MPIIDPEDPTLALTRALIARPSITPEDAGCQQLMMDRLSAAGFICEPMRFAEVDNFWATRGTQGPLTRVSLAIPDVVPPGDQSAWQSDPFPRDRGGNRPRSVVALPT
jgi:succinyl-diaminopimelate desuccinylase